MTAQNTAQPTTLGQLAELVEWYWKTRQKVKELEISLELAESSILKAIQNTGMDSFRTPDFMAYINAKGTLTVERRIDRGGLKVSPKRRGG